MNSPTKSSLKTLRNNVPGSLTVEKDERRRVRKSQPMSRSEENATQSQWRVILSTLNGSKKKYNIHN